jgi:hypothetical protein
VNAPGTVDVPMRTLGLTALTTDSKSVPWSFHSEASLTNAFCASETSVSVVRRPGLSINLSLTCKPHIYKTVSSTMVNLPDLFRSLLVTDLSFCRNGISHLVRYADARTARTKDHHPQVRKLLLAHMQTGEDRGEGDTAGPLHVIVETSHLRAVFVQNGSCYESLG